MTDFFGSFKDDMLARAPRVEAEAAARKTIKRHDFRTGGWGHTIGPLYDKERVQKRLFRKPIVTQYTQAPCALGLGVKDGDEILLRMESGKDGVFRCENVRYDRDPQDMFSVDLHFIGYAAPNEQSESTK